MGKRDEADHPEGRLATLMGRLQSNIGQIVLSTAFFVAAGLLAIYLWGRFSERILMGKNYAVVPENIHVPSPIPSWIRSDFKTEAITDGSLENMNVQQKDLQRRVAAAFEMHPWVSEVRRVTTRYPGQVYVDLAYRRPIAMVEVDYYDAQGELKPGLRPVDPAGTLLPTTGFTAEEAANDFLRIVAPGSKPNGTPGSPWGDMRVHGAAKIAQTLDKTWKRLQLATIIAHPDHTGLATSNTVYEIQTLDGTKIIWGHGPREEETTEPRADRKLQRLLSFVNQHGTLSVEPGEYINLSQADRLSVGKREDLDVVLQ